MLNKKTRTARAAKAIARAIAIAGGPTALGDAIGVSAQSVANWRARARIPAAHVLAVESATGVSRHEIRPDVFGDR